MTDKQYKEYKKAKEELEPVKNFLFWCGEKRVPSQTDSLFKMFFASLGIKFGFAKDEIFKMPKELRERVLLTIKDYVEEKETEMGDI